jgi:hypothetical protein
MADAETATAHTKNAVSDVFNLFIDISMRSDGLRPIAFDSSYAVGAQMDLSIGLVRKGRREGDRAQPAARAALCVEISMRQCVSAETQNSGNSLDAEDAEEPRGRRRGLCTSVEASARAVACFSGRESNF